MRAGEPTVSLGNAMVHLCRAAVCPLANSCMIRTLSRVAASQAEP